MENEKTANLADLPQPQTGVTATQQGEEFIDKSNLKKDEGDTADRKPGDSEEDKHIPNQQNKNREA
jgi:hypothetical protein